jgi:hypothetical protein
MITWKEMLCTYKESDIDPEHLLNMKDLHEKLQKIRTAYGKPMKISNCYRSMAHHLRIYKDKGIIDKKRIPMKSKHLRGEGVDIADPTGDFHAWCKSNEKLLIELGFWLEKRQGGWQHLQTVPFGSYKVGGTIWFDP